MPAAQIIIFLNPAGAPRAELPGANGMRTSIPLPEDWARANPEIMAALRGEQTRLNKNDEAARTRMDSIRQRELLERDLEWWDGLSADRRAELERKAQDPAKVREKIHELELGRARRVWAYIATHHTIDLADHAIPRERRPRASNGTVHKSSFNLNGL